MIRFSVEVEVQDGGVAVEVVAVPQRGAKIEEVVAANLIRRVEEQVKAAVVEAEGAMIGAGRN